MHVLDVGLTSITIGWRLCICACPRVLIVVVGALGLLGVLGGWTGTMQMTEIKVALVNWKSRALSCSSPAPPAPPARWSCMMGWASSPLPGRGGRSRCLGMTSE
jgi:hypothetical protein